MIFDRICVGQPEFGQERVGQRQVRPEEELRRIRLGVGAVIPVNHPIIPVYRYPEPVNRFGGAWVETTQSDDGDAGGRGRGCGKRSER
jgi:hypothetical protein